VADYFTHFLCLLDVSDAHVDEALAIYDRE